MPLFEPEEKQISSPPQPNLTVVKTFVASTTDSVTLLEPKKQRVGFSIFNNSTSPLYLDYGDAVSLENFAVKIKPKAYFESPFKTPQKIRGVWEAADGRALIRECVEVE